MSFLDDLKKAQDSTIVLPQNWAIEKKQEIILSAAQNHCDVIKRELLQLAKVSREPTIKGIHRFETKHYKGFGEEASIVIGKSFPINSSNTDISQLAEWKEYNSLYYHMVKNTQNMTIDVKRNGINVNLYLDMEHQHIQKKTFFGKTQHFHRIRFFPDFYEFVAAMRQAAIKDGIRIMEPSYSWYDKVQKQEIRLYEGEEMQGEICSGTYFPEIVVEYECTL